MVCVSAVGPPPSPSRECYEIRWEVREEADQRKSKIPSAGYEAQAGEALPMEEQHSSYRQICYAQADPDGDGEQECLNRLPSLCQDRVDIGGCSRIDTSQLFLSTHLFLPLRIPSSTFCCRSKATLRFGLSVHGFTFKC